MPKVNDNTKTLFIAVISFAILMLSLVNIKNFLSTDTVPEKVLGAEINTDVTVNFWNDFLTKNPEYIPGWLEIGRTDKAYSIDPNYQL